MLVVGELINTSRPKVKEAVENRDAQYIIEIAKAQTAAGATYLDINCGTLMDKEKEGMEWLVRTVSDAMDTPLCIDSPDPEVLRAGLKLCPGRSMINSTTFETERFNAIAPLAVEFKAKLIALCIDDNGMPDTSEDRVRIAGWMISRLESMGVAVQDIYIDPLVKPMSAGTKNGTDVLNAISRIITDNPGVHMICGLTNISFNLPSRKQINKTFMIQTMTLGMDAYIIDITNKEISGALYTSQLLLGQDKYCRNYIKAYRNGIFS